MATGAAWVTMVWLFGYLSAEWQAVVAMSPSAMWTGWRTDAAVANYYNQAEEVLVERRHW
jgi:hypothetical protein